jgi:hypothetical protein
MKTSALIAAAILTLSACSPAPAAPSETPAEPAAAESVAAEETPPTPESADTAILDQDIGPIVGGPCAYETKEVIGTVAAVDGAEVEFEDTDGQTFWMDLPGISSGLAAGTQLRFSKDFIVEGTCTPFSYTLIGPVTDEPASGN